MNNRPSNIAAALIAVGMIGAGCMVAYGLKESRNGDRAVTVKGLSERDVVADLAVWPLKTKVAGMDLVASQRELDQNVLRIQDFLKGAGFDSKDFGIKGMRVIDRRTQEYGSGNEGMASRYIIEATVLVRSNDVERVNQANQKIGDLIKSGVTLVEENSCTPGPNYVYTKLGEIKPEMLAEATAGARKAAEQFAVDSGSAVGAIRKAYQGIFSITPRDAVSESGEGGGCGMSDPNKKVRVVTTVEYFLNN